jgi:2-dehydro-3-deoxygluconokinase
MQKVVTFGEIMLRLSTPGYERFSQASAFESRFGGGEANVAVALARFGIPVEFVTRLPVNDLAERCLMELRSHSVGIRFICRGGERIGIYFLETGAAARGSQVIYDRAHSALSEVQPGMIDWDAVFQDASWFHFTGITPAVSASAADTCLEAVQAASRKRMTISVDLNYRKKLWKYGKSAGEVMSDLVKECDIILGNEEDAEKVFGITSETADVTRGHVEAEQYRMVCRKLTERFPKAKKVIITLRGSHSASHNTWRGAMWNGTHFFQSKQYDILPIVDRVGGGDSFMAGLIYGLLTYPEDEQRALDFAAAASCLKHTIPGDFNLVSLEEVEKLMGGDASGRVTR